MAESPELVIALSRACKSPVQLHRDKQENKLSPAPGLQSNSMMLSGSLASMQGATTHPHADVEGLSLLLAMTPVAWASASWCTEPARLGLLCQRLRRSTRAASHQDHAAWHGEAAQPAGLGARASPGEGLSADERCRCQAGCPGSPLAKVSGGSWERKNWQLGRMCLHFPSSCSLNHVPYLAFLTDRRNLMAETVTA